MDRSKRISLVALLVLFAGCPAAQLAPALQQDVQSQLDGRKDAYANCYTAALKRSETVKGDMNLTMVVGVDGQFTDLVVASGSVTDDQLKQCVIDATQGIGVSTPPPAPIQVTHSLNFEPGDVGGKTLGEGMQEGGMQEGGGAEGGGAEGGEASPPPAPEKTQ